MSRLVPYRSKASEEVAARIEQTLASTMYLVQTTGPTSYVIQEQNSEKKHRVLIGSMQTCSCGTADICTHILFVMLKVLRVPATTPVVWQKSLIDSEIETLLRAGYRERTRPATKPYVSKRKEAATAQVEDTAVERHDLVEGEVCAICQEDMEANQPLTFCRKGCGNNFHVECMKVFGESRRQSKENIICPLCRQDWGDLALSALKKEIDVANRAPNVHKGTSCRKCKTKPIRCERYRCVQCKNVDLCARCFKTNAHSNHAFVMKQNVPDPWVPAVRENQRKPAIDSDIIRDLENRELSTNDYDVLLQLDRGDKCPIQDYLVKAISGTKVDPENAKTFGEPGATCSLCSHSIRIKAALHSTVCGHVFHESCLSRSLLSQIYACPYPGCECALVPGLLYLQKKKQQASKTAQPADTKPELRNATPPLDPSFTVLGFHQHRLPAPLIEPSLPNAPSSRVVKRGSSRSSRRDDHELPSLPGLVSVGIVAHDRKLMHSNLPALSARGPTPSLNQIEHEVAAPTQPRTNSMQRARMKGKLVKATAGNMLPHLNQQQSLPQFPSDNSVTDNRLNQAEKIRAELKAIERERLQKLRLQREERQRRHKESDTNLAFTSGFLGAPGHEHDNVTKSQANGIPGQRAHQIRETKRKSNNGRQHHAQKQNQLLNRLPDLFIGSRG